MLSRNNKNKIPFIAAIVYLIMVFDVVIFLVVKSYSDITEHIVNELQSYISQDSVKNDLDSQNNLADSLWFLIPHYIEGTNEMYRVTSISIEGGYIFGDTGELLIGMRGETTSQNGQVADFVSSAYLKIGYIEGTWKVIGGYMPP